MNVFLFLLIVYLAGLSEVDTSPEMQTMNFAVNNGYRIHYKTVGEGTPVVLIFGFGMSLEEWFQFGYADKLAKHFKVIAIEPRGHGQSDAPVSPEEYNLNKLAGDVASVLDTLKTNQAHIWGYSLGAKVALSVANHHPERVQGLILGGFEIASEVHLSDDIVSSTLRKGGTAWRNLWESLMEVPPAMGLRLEKVNTEALLALRMAEAGWDSFEPLLKRVDTPSLLYVGEQCFSYNSMKKANALLNLSRLKVIPAQGHFSLIANMDAAIPKVIAFIKRPKGTGHR